MTLGGAAGTVDSSPTSGRAGAAFRLGPFRPERGGLIPEAVLHYRVFGDASRIPTHGASLVFHALTGNADLDQWWGPLLGPGRPLDPANHPIVAANLLGGCAGSTGPNDPAHEFPLLTPADLARAHAPLLDHLGATRLQVVAGGSLGGMVALHWGRLSPLPVDRLVILAAPARTSAQAIGWNAAQRMAIEADSDWEGGRYQPGRGPVAGLAAARAIAMITYRSAAELDCRFGRARDRRPGRFDVEEYLRRHGDKLVARFDARSYVALMNAMDHHDLGDLHEAARETARRVRRIIGVGIDSDQLYPAAEIRRWVERYAAAGASAEYREITSHHGHDAFLIEFDQLAPLFGNDPEPRSPADSAA